MSFASIAIIMAWIAGAFLTLLAYVFWTNPKLGFEQTSHRPEQLPLVMADRYTALAVLAAFFAFYGDLTVIAVFFAVCAVMGFCDALIYARAGHSHIKHTIAGVMSLVAIVVAVIGLMSGGAG